MELKEALQASLKADKHTHADSFLLYSRVCDLVGNDYEAKKAAEDFYRLDAKYEISSTILACAPKAKRRKRKKHVYKIKPLPSPPDDAYVYFSYNSAILHISGECPCLKGVPYFFQSTYRQAISNHKKPQQICRQCGHFSAQRAHGLRYHLSMLLYDCFSIEPRERTIFPR